MGFRSITRIELEAPPFHLNIYNNIQYYQFLYETFPFPRIRKKEYESSDIV